MSRKYQREHYQNSTVYGHNEVSGVKEVYLVIVLKVHISVAKIYSLVVIYGILNRREFIKLVIFRIL